MFKKFMNITGILALTILAAVLIIGQAPFPSTRPIVRYFSQLHIWQHEDDKAIIIHGHDDLEDSLGYIGFNADGEFAIDAGLNGIRMSGIFDSDQVIYVDVGQTNSNESGNFGDPCKTIMAAIDTIIARGDNTEALNYTIFIAPGTYTETIDLDSDELYNISLIAIGGPRTVFIDPSSGRSLESDTLNENLHYLYVYGLTFADNIALSGAQDSSQFLRDYCVFEQCVQTSVADSLILDNIGRFKWYNGELNICNIIDVDNAYIVEFGGMLYYDMPPFTGAPGVTTITANTGNDTPYDMISGGQMSYTIKNCFNQRQEPTLTSTAGSVRYRVYDSFCGFNGTITVANNDDFYAINSTINSSVVVTAGSTIFLYNTAILGSYSGTTSDDHIYGSTEGAGLNAATK